MGSGKEGCKEGWIGWMDRWMDGRYRKWDSNGIAMGWIQQGLNEAVKHECMEACSHACNMSRAQPPSLHSSSPMISNITVGREEGGNKWVGWGGVEKRLGCAIR